MNPTASERAEQDLEGGDRDIHRRRRARLLDEQVLQPVAQVLGRAAWYKFVMCRALLSPLLLLSLTACPEASSGGREHDAAVDSGPDRSMTSADTAGLLDAGMESEADGSRDGDGDADSGQPDGEGGPQQSDAGASLDDVDLTLGGLNQDLPPPAMDCLQTLHPQLVCFSITGEHNGVPIAATCDAGNSGTSTNSRNFECTVDTGAAGTMRIVITLSTTLTAPVPKAFEFFRPPAASADAVVRLYLTDRAFNTGSDKALLSHQHQIAVAGVSYHGPGWNPSRTAEFERGTFAATSSPKAGCVPDDMGFACDSIRIRGVFSARTLAYLD